MPIVDQIIGTGTSPFAANAIAGGSTTLTAAGSTLATGTLISTGNAYFSIVSSGKGGTLPACGIGSNVFVYNGGANTLATFPNASTEVIANGSAGAAFSVASNKGCNFVKLTSTQWGVNLSA